MFQARKMHNNKQLHHHQKDHEDQSQHVDHHVATVQSNMKQIEIINS
jgi:hypothetical protein